MVSWLRSRLRRARERVRGVGIGSWQVLGGISFGRARSPELLVDAREVLERRFWLSESPGNACVFS